MVDHDPADDSGGMAGESPRPISEPLLDRTERPVDATSSDTTRSDKKSSARLRFATLNVRGYGHRTASGTSDKWLCINQIMRENKLAVLAIQEAHLPQSRIDELNTFFDHSLKIFGSSDEVNATGARGVAFAVNKRILETERLSVNSIVEGRAMTLTFNWTSRNKLTLLNVYAPNRESENAEFWRTLTDHFDAPGRRKPDLMLGDFNIVERACDRFPPHTDSVAATEELAKLTSSLQLVDGLVERQERRAMFTYLQKSTGSQSRIDRIYINSSLVR